MPDTIGRPDGLVGDGFHGLSTGRAAASANGSVHPGEVVREHCQALGSIAQLGERPPVERKVAGSKPVGAARLHTRDRLSPSSRGQGCRILSPVTRVRIPLGVLEQQCFDLEGEGLVVGHRSRKPRSAQALVVRLHLLPPGPCSSTDRAPVSYIGSEGSIPSEGAS